MAKAPLSCTTFSFIDVPVDNVNTKNNQSDQKVVKKEPLRLFSNFVMGLSAKKGSQSNETFATRVNPSFPTLPFYDDRRIVTRF